MDKFVAKAFRGTRDVLESYGIVGSKCSVLTPPEKPLIGARHISYGIILDVPKDRKKVMDLGEDIALAADVEEVMISREKGTIWIEYELPEKYHKDIYFSDLMGAGIGIGSGGNIVNFDFAFPHTICAGETGSGKTELIKTIISYLMVNYSEDELRIAICDPHKDFSIFDGSVHLIERQSEPGGILELVRRFYKEAQRRVRQNDRENTRLVLVMDECQSGDCIGTKMFGFNDEILRTIQKLSQETRKFKMNLILGSQKPSGENLPYILENMGQKGVGKVFKRVTGANLTGRDGLYANKLMGFGDFYWVAKTVTRVQVALTNDYSFLKHGYLNSPFDSSDEVFHNEIFPELLSEFPMTYEDAKTRFNLSKPTFDKYFDFHTRFTNLSGR